MKTPRILALILGIFLICLFPVMGADLTSSPYVRSVRADNSYGSCIGSACNNLTTWDNNIATFWHTADDGTPVTSYAWQYWNFSQSMHITGFRAYLPHEGDTCTNFTFNCNGVRISNHKYPFSFASGVYGWYNITLDLNCQNFEIQYRTPWVFDLMKVYEIEILGNLPIGNNTYPSLNIPNLEQVYCLNKSNPVRTFILNFSDAESDTILYFPSWNNEYSQENMIDSFSSTSYSMLENGWSFSAPGCNYSTTTGNLQLYSGCNNIGMIKWLDSSYLNQSLDVTFDSFVYLNTTGSYEIWNGYNQKIAGIKLSKYLNPVYNSLYTNLSYWNGSTYRYFDDTYYDGYIQVELQFNSTHVKFCVSGIDQIPADGCQYEIIEELHGTTDNVPGKFYILPTYNFQWEEYETPYVYLDNLKYKLSDNIPFYTYSGENLVHWIDEEEQEILTVYVTDTIHNPDYVTYEYPITIQGLCSIPKHNETEDITTPITTNTRDYIKSIDDGEAKFNAGFYIILFLVFIGLLVFTRSIAITLMIVGFTGLFSSWFLSGDFTQMITSFSVMALGIAMLIAGVI